MMIHGEKRKNPMVCGREGTRVKVEQKERCGNER